MGPNPNQQNLPMIYFTSTEYFKTSKYYFVSNKNCTLFLVSDSENKQKVKILYLVPYQAITYSIKLLLYLYI